jgi:hypothetical protein
MNKEITKFGQIGTGVLIASAIGLGGLIFSLFGYNLLANNKTDSQVQEVKQELADKGERIAKNEARYEEILRRLSSIDDKLKELKR